MRVLSTFSFFLSAEITEFLPILSLAHPSISHSNFFLDKNNGNWWLFFLGKNILKRSNCNLKEFNYMRIRFTCSPHLFFHLAISESPIFWNGLWKSTFIGISLRKYVWKKREVKTSTKIDMKSFGIAWSDRAVFCSRYFYSFSRFLFRSNYIVQPSSYSSINRQKKEQADEWPHKTHLLDPAIYWTHKIFSNDSWACARASQYRAVIFFSMNETRQNLSLNVNGLIQSRRKEWMNLLFGVATHWDCALNAEEVQWTIILR